MSAKEFSIRQVLLKRASFDAPRVERIFLAGGKLDMEQIEFRMSSEMRRLLEDRYGLTLQLEVRALIESQEVFQATVEEVGIFRIAGYTEEETLDLIRTKGVEALYPYARELVHSLASRCGIQRLGLPPLAIEGAGSEGWTPEDDRWGVWLTHRD